MTEQADTPQSDATPPQATILRTATSRKPLTAHRRGWQGVLRTGLRSRGLAAGQQPQSRWLRWAEEIARRATAGHNRAPDADMTLRTPAPAAAAVVHPLHLHTHVAQTAAWSLALVLRLGGPSSTQAGSTPGAPTAAAPGAPAAPPLHMRLAQTPAQSPPPAPSAPAPPLPLVTRLYSRDGWLHTHAVQRTLLQAPVVLAPKAALQTPLDPPPLPRVVSAPPVTTQAAAGATASPAPAPLAPGALRYWSDAPQHPPPHDVEQLTDQVIRAIDQRVAAARERLGKSALGG